MKITKTGTIVVAAAAGLLSTAYNHGSAVASSYSYPGSGCQPTSTENFSRSNGVEYENDDPGIRDAWCPVGAFTASSLASVTEWDVWYYDGNATNGDNINCSMYASNTAGTLWQSSRKYSCSTFGGCDSTPNTYSGYGTLQLTSPMSGPTSARAGVALDCKLAADGGTPSFIHGYNVTY